MWSEDGWKERGGARDGNRKVDLKILLTPEGLREQRQEEVGAMRRVCYFFFLLLLSQQMH